MTYYKSEDLAVLQHEHVHTSLQRFLAIEVKLAFAVHLSGVADILALTVIVGEICCRVVPTIDLELDVISFLTERSKRGEQEETRK